MNDRKQLILHHFLEQIEQIDYNGLSNNFKFVIIWFNKMKIKTKFKINKNYKLKSVRRVLLPPELKLENPKISIKSKISSEFYEHLTKFSKIMIENFDEENLINFYNNINTLKIFNKTEAKPFKMSFYNPFFNFIVLYRKNYSTTIYHELLHMASSINKKGIYSGFYQNDLGRSITEGYTELLTRRYFVDKTKNSLSYEFSSVVAEMLEMIVGKQKMENLYFNANLKGLIEELRKYSIGYDVMEFISNTDYILQNFKSVKSNSFEYLLFENNLKDIGKFLIKICAESLLLKIEKNELTPDQSINIIKQFMGPYLAELNKFQKLKKVENILTPEEIDECIKSSLRDSFGLIR